MCLYLYYKLNNILFWNYYVYIIESRTKIVFLARESTLNISYRMSECFSLLFVNVKTHSFCGRAARRFGDVDILAAGCHSRHALVSLAHDSLR